MRSDLMKESMLEREVDVTVNIVSNFFGYLYHSQSQSDSFNKFH